MSTVLDVVLVLVLLAYLVQGWRLGLIRSLGAIAGVVAGALAAALAAPWIGSLVPDDTGRVVATVVAAIVLVLLGHALGAAVGAAVGGLLHRGPLGRLDRVLGAAAGLVVSALAVSTVASLAVGLGVPDLAQPVAGSVVLRAITGATPAPVAQGLAQLRSTVLHAGIPSLGSPLGTSGTDAVVPGAPSSSALDAALASVVKITGRAPACGQEQDGSGFVVARDRVLTNAHVVQGTARSVVLSQDGSALAGRVVAYDPHRDLAVLDVPGLAAAPLPIAPEAAVGATGLVAGYPYGGPLARGGARVLRSGSVRVPDIGDEGTTVRRVAELAADVEPGDSGGPLLDADGGVLGVVFARSTDRSDVGYAMTRQEFAGAVDAAAGEAAAVPTGTCSRD